MGKEAARMQFDTAGHTGPIVTGSFNVFIGGMPAARKGDSFICSTHGIGAITEGSSTVLINGKSAARINDKTSCGALSLPSEVGPAPEKYNFITPVKDNKLNNDGTVNTTPDWLDAKFVTAYANQEDLTGGGNYDKINFGATLANLKGSNEWKFNGNKIGVNGGLRLYDLEGDLGYYNEDKIVGLEANAKATMVGGDMEISNEGSYGNKVAIGANGDLLTAGANAKSVLRKGYEGIYGYQVDVGAEAHVAKGEVIGENQILGIVNIKVKVSGSVGSVGVSAGGGGYVDTDDYIASVNVNGELAVLLGIGVDIEITVGDLTGKIKSFFQNLFGENEKESVSLEGVIISGCSNVIIG